ncbi:hypothetical protein PHJA_002603500 [Phtheirospermum japonicum]|uniref:Uncharacterized protein n=1 Tax=Phtheirospermum japonicum TaxID=374723 RepID=A0A830DC33_9LAMI|nr:hypothetical protein PHJA_002603500 [Phtheirospermum japonicum]
MTLSSCCETQEISKVGPLTEKCELGQVTESDAVSVEVSEQDSNSNEAEDQVAELDDEIEKSDGVSVEVSGQDSNESEDQVAESDDQIERLDAVSVGVSEHDSNEADDQVAELDDEIEKSDALSVEVSEQDSNEPEHQVAESDDEIEKLDAVTVKVSKHDSNLNEAEHQVAESDDEIEKLDAVHVEVSEHDSNVAENQVAELDDEIQKSDVVSVEVSEQFSNEGEDQVAESDDQIKKSDVVSFEVSEQISNEADDQVAESDDQIKKSDAVRVEVSKHDSNKSEDQVAELDDDIERLDVVNVEVSEHDSNSNEAEHQVAESDDEIKKSDAVIVEVSEHDSNSNEAEHQVAELDDELKNPDAMDVELSEHGLNSNEAENQVADLDDELKKLDATSVELSEHDSNSNEAEHQVAEFDDELKNPDAMGVELTEHDSSSNEAEHQVAKLDAVNGKVNEHPTVKWDKEYPPLPTSSRKVSSNIVALTSRKEVPNIKNDESVAEPFSILMKVPRLDDASIQEQINLAKLQLEEKTRIRDSIQVQIQEKRANIQIHGLDYESANDEGKKAKKLVKSKIKQLRDESPADLGSEDELHLKILRKELQILKECIETAAAAATEAEKKCDAANVKIKQLQVKCRAATEARQAAYVHLQSLKKKLSTKNQQFFQYKDDAAFANNYAGSGNKKALHRLCTNQVEKLMELWNTNDEFHRDYVMSNTRSTIRRLGTLDGRSLGPGEKPPVLPSYPHERINLAPKIPTSVKNVTPDDKLLKRTKEHENRKVTNKKTALKEAELTKKAEEMLRREEAEAKLKEQRRLEELAKAEVAREKRLRKKEKMKQKKKAAVVAAAMDDVNYDISNSETATAQTSKDVVEINADELTVVPKKAQKSRQLTKALSVPPALLRNRNKKSYRQLMWTGLISLFVYILFWLGNVDVFSKLSVVDWPISILDW